MKLPSVLREAVRSLSGRRLATTFGTWRGLAMHDRDAEEHWEPMISFKDLQRLVNEGDSYARALLDHINDPQHYLSPGPPPQRIFAVTSNAADLPPPKSDPQLDLFHNPADLQNGFKSLQPL
jgi:hypothetical protein